MSFCKNCGFELKEGDLFCNNCGTKIEEDSGIIEKKESPNTQGETFNSNMGNPMVSCAPKRNLGIIIAVTSIIAVMLVLAIIFFVYNPLKKKNIDLTYK